ncbi:hypothetical protein LIPSTDRAFT_71900 [Lipomyces starkeyi NRRL Y-11557]|uniref:hAT-like transposase RNase-H fold domain-containing protein n=1 Tax=Lipomyces starkeyi NRRL Y-11557 TaxID=675824 RepID=A0A1E3Q3S8_LIPST|nr:hypothetical protein LIPSTDRAFT_71900 [Lipomyces starkeyi NRRL Y-11557]
MCRFIASGLQERGIVDWDPVHHRVRCQGHVINLAVQAFLFSKDREAVDEALRQAEQDETIDIDDSLANCIKSAKAAASERRYNWFKGVAGQALGLDNETRWNSWYLMLVTALKSNVRTALHQYVDNWYTVVKEDYLSPDDWQTLEETATFLQPFYRATLETEGDKATLDRTLYTMDILVRHFRRSKVKHKDRIPYIS